MFYGYHITINRETSDIDAAYKIFFIILELIIYYQLSSLFQTNIEQSAFGTLNSPAPHS